MHFCSLLRSRFEGRHATSLKTAAKETSNFVGREKTRTFLHGRHLDFLD